MPDPVQAALVYDTKAQPLSAGVRATVQRARRVMFAAEETELSAAAAAALEGNDEVSADEVFVVKISPSYARDFVARAQALVAAGRPPCPFCLQPLDPAGHVCPRQNGYRR